MLILTEKDYWISANALTITLNALDNPDYIQASAVNGAMIMAHADGIPGLDYDAGHNFRRWPLQAAPTAFNTHTEKYVYVAIPRPVSSSEAAPQSNALLVFPSEQIDIYGKNAAEEQIGSDQYYYIFLNGILTSSGTDGTTPRVWKSGQAIRTGKLNTDEAINAPESDWYSYNSLSGILTFLKNLTMKATTIFINLFAHRLEIKSYGDEPGSINFENGNGSIEKVAVFDEAPVLSGSPLSDKEIVTPAYLSDREAEVEKKYLRKDQNDETEFGLTMATLRVNGKADIFGNLIAKKDAVIAGNVSVGGDLSVDAKTKVNDLTIGTFNKGIEGGYIDALGNGELESLILRRSLRVPELIFNRTTITVGNKWQTEGAGIIENVWEGPVFGGSAYEGIAQLKLEQGEIGAIAVDDKCQGVFHLTTKDNDPATIDNRDGNFHFAGFTTIFFLVKEIYTADTLPEEILAELGEDAVIGNNQFFRYELRAATCRYNKPTDPEYWTDDTHPQPDMHFAAYSNATNPSRQASRLTTTTYQLHLAGMTKWTYTQDNIRAIIGNLEGFTLDAQVWDRDSKQFVRTQKPLHGEGIAIGNMYMWGNIDQFDRAPAIISQELLYHTSADINDRPDGIIVSPDHASYLLNGWQREAIATTEETPFVWQQYLYTYSDGTYDVSDLLPPNSRGADGKPGEPGAPGADIAVEGGALKFYDVYSDYFNDNTKDSGLYLVFGRLDPMSMRPRSLAGAYVYTYNAETDTTTIEDALQGQAYIVEETGNLFVATIRAEESSVVVGNDLYWQDCGLFRGQDAITLVVDSDQVIFTDKSTTQRIFVDVYKGKNKLAATDYTISPLSDTDTILNGKVRWLQQTITGRSLYRLSVLSAYYGEELSGTIPFTVTVDGVAYQRTLIIRTVLNGTNGDPGYDGCIIRRTEWQEGVLYRNDTNVKDGSATATENGSTLAGEPTSPVQGGSATAESAPTSPLSPDGNRYIDEVCITNPLTSETLYFVATEAHNGIASSEENKPSSAGNAYWTPINDLRPLRTPFADIDQALIDYLQLRQLVITEPAPVQGGSAAVPYGAFGAGEWPLWFGGIDWLNSVFRVNRQGHLFSKKLVAFGTQSPDGSATGPRVEIENGLARFFGNQSHPNITLGTDTNGCAILNFYDQAGNKMYDLGPNGLQYTKVQPLSWIIHKASVVSGIGGEPSNYDVWFRNWLLCDDDVEHINLIINASVDNIYQYLALINAGAYVAVDANTYTVPFNYSDGSGSGTTQMQVLSNLTAIASADLDRKFFIQPRVGTSGYDILSSVIVSSIYSYQGERPDAYNILQRWYPSASEITDQQFAQGVRYRHVTLLDTQGHTVYETNIYFQ